MPRDERRSGTKITKATKITKRTPWVFFVAFVVFAVFATAREPSVASAQAPGDKPTEAQQRPVFRGGTHFVRVDAYPAQNGKILEGLTAEDFEIFEDGKPQKIESFDFIKFDTYTPESARRDPKSQQEGFDLAADPRFRVFVIVVHVRSGGIEYIQDPLIQFLDRVLGSADLFGLLTTSQSAHDLVLGQKSTTARATIADFWRSGLIDRTPADDALDQCGPPGWAVKGLFALDQTYVSLESLVQQLGSLRQERKNLIFVSNGLPSPRPKPIADSGPLRGDVPKIGVVNGRPGIGDNSSTRPGTNLFCSSEIQRLTGLDFDRRFRDLLTEARRQNVSIHAITPAGLQAPVTPAGMDRVRAANDSLLTLANETDGVAIVDTNDLTGGMRRIADDLAAYYLLGYYTTNTRFDGGLRSIKVQLKANAAAGIKGGNIRARRQYRAPTPAEISALSTVTAPAAAAAPPPTPLTLVKKPAVFVVRGKAAPEPAEIMRLSRTERLRVEWEITATVDQRSVRVLDRGGKPLAVDVPVTEENGRLTAELPLAAFARGDFTLELTIGSGSIVERSPLAFRVQ